MSPLRQGRRRKRKRMMGRRERRAVRKRSRPHLGEGVPDLLLPPLTLTMVRAGRSAG